MSRNIDPALSAAFATGAIFPIVLVMLTFKSGTRYVWTGIGTLVWNAQSFIGIGSAGSVGAISEGTEVTAAGTTVGLSGIDPVLQAECLTDIQLGAPAKIWFGLMTARGVLVGSPYLVFSGLVDKPTFSIAPETLSISLALESRLVDLSRASQRRYTAADQHRNYPDDTGFNWVEILNDISLRWGS